MILLLLYRKEKEKSYMLNVKIGIGKAEIFPHFLRWYWLEALCSDTRITQETFLIERKLLFSYSAAFYDHGNFPPTPTKIDGWKGRKKAFWLDLCMCFSECGSTITIKAQIMRINVCKKLFIRLMRRRSMMHIFMVLCKSFLIFFRFFSRDSTAA
jgi:hypothetical protein